MICICQWYDDYPAFNDIVLDLSAAQVESRHPVSIEQLVVSKICSVREQDVETYETAIEHIFDGKTLLFIEGMANGYVLNLEKEKNRTFGEPSTERVVRGPKLGFIESLQENIGLIRQYSNHPNLIVQQQKFGTMEKREVALIFYEGKASDSLLKEVNKRIKEGYLKDVERVAEDEVKKDVEKIVYKLQHDYKTGVAGLYRYVQISIQSIGRKIRRNGTRFSVKLIFIMKWT
ncbi:hypothetical protein FOA20_16395 [Peribacillus simplex]